MSSLRFRLTPLVIALSAVINPGLQAAEPLDVQKTTLHNLQKQFNIQLPGAKAVSQPLPNSLSVVKTHKDNKQKNHIQLQQIYDGFEVLGGRAVLHQVGATETMNGTVYQGLEKELGKATADFVPNARDALAAFKASYAGKVIKDEVAKPLVYIDEDNKAHWAYMVSFLVELSSAMPEKPTAIVDAVTNKPFMQWNDLRTRISVQAMGFGGNPKIGLLQYDGLALPLLKMTRDTIERRGVMKCYMENDDVKVVDMSRPRNVPMQFPCRFTSNDKTMVWTGYAGDGYDKVNDGYSPSNDALFSGNVVKHMYRDWYGVEVLLNRDDTPMQLFMRVHYEEEPGVGYDNAFWYNGKMTFGDGGRSSYPQVSIGATGHEVSHGFTEQNCNFLYTGQTGGMDESFSDMANIVADYFATGKFSWAIGGEVMRNTEALRYMDLPSKDGQSIDTATQYKNRMDPHNSSGVYNRLFYLMSTQDGSWNPRRAFAIMVKANMDYWYGDKTFDQAACGVLSAAKDLGEPVDGIKKAMDVVRVKYQSCM